MSDTSRDSVHLHVLPHSGKVEQLKHELSESTQQLQQTQPTLPGSSSAVPSPEATTDAAISPRQRLLEGKVIAAIRTVFDPEIPINIYELGLIYKIDVRPDDTVKVEMTLTAPACPVAGTLPGEVAAKIQAVDGVKDAEVELVWEPAWDKSRMSEAALLDLGML